MEQHVLLHLEVTEMRTRAICRKSEATLIQKRKKTHTFRHAPEY